MNSSLAALQKETAAIAANPLFYLRALLAALVLFTILTLTVNVSGDVTVLKSLNEGDLAATQFHIAVFSFLRTLRTYACLAAGIAFPLLRSRAPFTAWTFLFLGLIQALFIFAGLF